MNSTAVHRGRYLDPSYYVLDFWNQHCHPRTLDLLQSPLFLFPIVGSYLLFVLVIGPRFMKHREPYDLRNIMKIYNYVNVIGNFGLCSTALYYTRFTYECWMCQESTAPTALLILAGYAYLSLKIFDLSDTIFFVLRKKDNQVTPLHVTHHAIMPFTAWLAFKFAPIPSSGVVLILNSAVHTVMYAYYHLASLGKDVWWKKYITVMQLIQFYIVLVHAIHTFFIPNCNYPRWFASLQLSEALFFVIMFTRFYLSSYKKKKQQSVTMKQNAGKQE